MKENLGFALPRIQLQLHTIHKELACFIDTGRCFTRLSIIPRHIDPEEVLESSVYHGLAVTDSLHAYVYRIATFVNTWK